MMDMPLGYLLHRVITALRAEVIQILEPLGLSFPEYLCLRQLSATPGQSNAQLARAGNVSPQAMNMVVRALQQRGLVDRPTASSSGRALPAVITTRGTALLAQTDAGIRAAEDNVLARFDAAERAEFRRLLTALATAD